MNSGFVGRLSLSQLDAIDAEALGRKFRALADPTRLQILACILRYQGQILVDLSGEVREFDGRTVGEICCELGCETSSSSRISFHLKELKNAGLVSTERQGKSIVCRANIKELASLGYLFVGLGIPIDN